MVSKTSRLRARPEKVVFETETGDIEYSIRPLKTKEILHMQELVSAKKDTEAFVYFIYITLKKDDPDISEEDVKELEANYLMKLMKVIERVNGMEGMFTEKSEIIKKKSEELKNPVLGLNKESFHEKIKSIQQQSNK